MDAVKLMQDENYSRNKRLVMSAWFLFCFVVAVIVRVYKVADIPYGIHFDEAGMGYDAWSLQKYHVDRWLNSFPVYMINFGGAECLICIFKRAIY